MGTLIDEILTCPECNGDHLHHGGVIVGYSMRPKGGERLVTLVNRGGVATTLNSEHNERINDSILIEFECEKCGELSMVLKIEAHEGRTRAKWIDKTMIFLFK